MNTNILAMLAAVATNSFPAKNVLPPPNIFPPGANIVTNTNVVSTNKVGPVGQPAPKATVSIAWDDASITEHDVVGYNVYFGTVTNPIPRLAEIRSWRATNGEVQINLSGLDPALVHYVDVTKVYSNGIESPPSPVIAFIPPKFIAATGNIVSYYSFGTNSILQSKTTNGIWRNELSKTNVGIVAFTNTYVSFPGTNGATNFNPTIPKIKLFRVQQPAQ